MSRSSDPLWRGVPARVGARERSGPVGFSTIDQPEFERFALAVRAAADADNLAHLTGTTQRGGERAADQADTDDDQTSDQRCAHASAFFSASMKRAFSVSRPIETRSHSGIA